MGQGGRKEKEMVSSRGRIIPRSTRSKDRAPRLPRKPSNARWQHSIVAARAPPPLPSEDLGGTSTSRRGQNSRGWRPSDHANSALNVTLSESRLIFCLLRVTRVVSDISKTEEEGNSVVRSARRVRSVSLPRWRDLRPAGDGETNKKSSKEIGGRLGTRVSGRKVRRPASGERAASKRRGARVDGNLEPL